MGLVCTTGLEQGPSLEAECQRRGKNVEVAGVVGSCVTEKERMAVTTWMLGDIFLKSHSVREVKSMGGGEECGLQSQVCSWK